MSLRIKHGDTVLVLAGADKGRTGKVMRVDPRKSRVYVEGVAMQYRHVRRSQQNPKGGRIQQEGPVNLSNVQLVTSAGDGGQRFKVDVRDSGRVRVGVKDGKDLD